VDSDLDFKAACCVELAVCGKAHGASVGRMRIENKRRRLIAKAASEMVHLVVSIGLGSGRHITHVNSHYRKLPSHPPHTLLYIPFELPQNPSDRAPSSVSACPKVQLLSGTASSHFVCRALFRGIQFAVPRPENCVGWSCAFGRSDVGQ